MNDNSADESDVFEGEIDGESFTDEDLFKKFNLSPDQ
jgi:hypothetical protein